MATVSPTNDTKKGVTLTEKSHDPSKTQKVEVEEAVETAATQAKPADAG